MIQKLYVTPPEGQQRVETGPVQFHYDPSPEGADWPGIFIRGDNAAWYATVVKQVLETVSSESELSTVVGLMALLHDLESSYVKIPGQLEP